MYICSIYGIKNNKYNRLIILFVLTISCILWLSGSASALSNNTPSKSIAVELSLVSQKNTITAYEPVIVKIKLANQSQQKARFNGLTTCLEVCDANGEIVAATPQPMIGEEGVLRCFMLAPGESRSKLWVVSGLYQFKKLGKYSIHIKQLEYNKNLSVIAEDSVLINVTPYNTAKLKARCEDIFQSLRTCSSDKTDIPMETRVKALYSTRNDVALPYLEWMAREWNDRYSCRAIRRIGSKKAKALLSNLTAKHGNVGIAARKSLKIPLKTMDVFWEMGDSSFRP